LWFPAVQTGQLETRRIFDGKVPSPNFLVTLRDDSGVEFLHLSGIANDGKWAGAVSERSLARATGLFPHFPQSLPVKLLASEPATQQLAIRCGDRVDILAPRGALFGEKGVGVAGKGNLPAGMSSGRSTAALPCNFWAACRDGNAFWTVSENEWNSSSRVSKFSFAPDGWRIARQDYLLEPPAGLSKGEAGGLLEAAITKHPTRNSIFVLWDKVTSTRLTEQATSLDVMVARYDLPEDNKPHSQETGLVPVLEFRLSAHPKGALRTVREFFVDASGEVLVYATENSAASYAVGDGKLLYKLPAANRFAVSPDRRYLALGDWRQDRKVEVRDSRSGEKIMETPESHTVKSIAFTPDGNQLAFGCKAGFMECFDVLTGSRIQRISTDLFPILLLSGGDRYLGMRIAEGKETGDVYLADRTDGLPISHMGSTHFLNHWYDNLDGNLIFQVTKFEVAVHRRSTPEQVQTWLDTLWPGGVVPRCQVLADLPNEEIFRKFLIDDDIGRYRPPPTASPP
jgi:hypothetical protein